MSNIMSHIGFVTAKYSQLPPTPQYLVYLRPNKNGCRYQETNNQWPNADWVLGERSARWAGITSVLG